MIIEFDKSFSKSLDKLKDSDVNKRIELIILDFDKVGKITDVKNIKKLVGFKSYYRVRIGNRGAAELMNTYKNSFIVNNDRLGIELKTSNIARLIVIAHRKDIYKIFP